MIYNNYHNIRRAIDRSLLDIKRILRFRRELYAQSYPQARKARILGCFEHAMRAVRKISGFRKMHAFRS